MSIPPHPCNAELIGAYKGLEAPPTSLSARGGCTTSSPYQDRVQRAWMANKLKREKSIGNQKLSKHVEEGEEDEREMVEDDTDPASAASAASVSDGTALRSVEANEQLFEPAVEHAGRRRLTKDFKIRISWKRKIIVRHRDFLHESV